MSGLLKSAKRARENAGVDIVFKDGIYGKYTNRIRGPAPDFTADGYYYRSSKMESMVRKGVAFIDPNFKDQFYVNNGNMVVFRAKKTRTSPPMLEVFDVFQYKKSNLVGLLVEKTELAKHF